VGQRNLFGILAEPTTIRDGAPSVVFINAGILPHSGPARIWVDLARRWAASGARVLRVDLSGIGDSPTPAGSPANLPYPIEAIEDTTEAAQFMAPDDPAGVVLVGLCSGAYHVLETATRLASRHAWLINPGSPMTLTSGEGGARDPRRQAVRPLNPLTRRLRQIDPLVQAVNSLMPPAVWWVLDKVRLYPSPAGALDSLARLGTEMILICGDEEADRYMKRSLLTMRRLQRLRAFRFERVPGMDHSLFGRQGRLSAIRLLDAQIGEQLL
jgi:pimeloyl-ACP methyl ester carboxylesterase